MTTPPLEVETAITRLAREESGRVLALLARRFNDLDLADEAVQEALIEAARVWPEQGVPSNPAGWLLAVARRKAIDRLRRAASARRRTMAAAHELAAQHEPDDDTERSSMISDDDLSPATDDEHLRLVLLCCHPALDQDTQVALTLRLVGGLTTSEIAAAFLIPEPTLAQRVVRAKRKIRDAGMPLSIPSNLAERVDVLLGVLYLIFNEGYLTRGEHDGLVRVDLVDEAVRLTQLVAQLVPANPEVEGLLALELFHKARMAARSDRAGDLILLEQQDRSQWDLATIQQANAVLATRDAAHGARAVPDAGRHRGAPCQRPHRGRHRLAVDRRPLRATRADDAVAGRATQPCGGHRDGRRPARRPGHARPPRRARELPPVPRRARRAAAASEPTR
jgi:RNA polymerase sigma-70 factor (ECF subfamily)